jgi:hypothetical protein
MGNNTTTCLHKQPATQYHCLAAGGLQTAPVGSKHESRAFRIKPKSCAARQACKMMSSKHNCTQDWALKVGQRGASLRKKSLKYGSMLESAVGS